MSRSFRYHPLPPPVFDDKMGYDFTPLVVWVEMFSDAHRWSGSIAALLSHIFFYNQSMGDLQDPKLEVC